MGLLSTCQLVNLSLDNFPHEKKTKRNSCLEDAGRAGAWCWWLLVLEQVVRSLCHVSSQDATLPVTVESPQGKDAQNCSPIERTRPLMAWRNTASRAKAAKHFRYVSNWNYLLVEVSLGDLHCALRLTSWLMKLMTPWHQHQCLAPAFQVHGSVRCLCDSCSKTCASRTQRNPEALHKDPRLHTIFSEFPAVPRFDMF